jgi:hypothetical protein
MNMVKIVRIDGKSKPITDFKGTTYHPEAGKLELYEYPIYTVPEVFARHMISQRPQWYKLFDSKPLSCPVEDNKGARTYVIFNPWKVVAVRIPVLKNGEPEKDDKGKDITKPGYKWVEVTEEKQEIVVK